MNINLLNTAYSFSINSKSLINNSQKLDLYILKNTHKISIPKFEYFQYSMNSVAVRYDELNERGFPTGCYRVFFNDGSYSINGLSIQKYEEPRYEESGEIDIFNPIHKKLLRSNPRVEFRKTQTIPEVLETTTDVPETTTDVPETTTDVPETILAVPETKLEMLEAPKLESAKKNSKKTASKKSNKENLADKWSFYGETLPLNKKAPLEHSTGTYKKSKNEFKEGIFNKNFELIHGKERFPIENGILIENEYENGHIWNQYYFPNGISNYPYFMGELNEKNKPKKGTLYFSKNCKFEANFEYISDEIKGRIKDFSSKCEVIFKPNLNFLGLQGQLKLSEDYSSESVKNAPNKFSKFYVGPIFWDKDLLLFSAHGKGGRLFFDVQDRKYQFNNCVFEKGELISGQGVYISDFENSLFKGTISKRTHANGLLIMKKGTGVNFKETHVFDAKFDFNYDSNTFIPKSGWGQFTFQSGEEFFGEISNGKGKIGISHGDVDENDRVFMGDFETNKGIYFLLRNIYSIGEFHIEPSLGTYILKNGIVINIRDDNSMNIVKVECAHRMTHVDDIPDADMVVKNIDLHDKEDLNFVLERGRELKPILERLEKMKKEFLAKEITLKKVFKMALEKITTEIHELQNIGKTTE